MPKFKYGLVIREKRGDMLETKRRYEVLLDGKSHGQIYFNTRGYVGGLPDIYGQMIWPGEVSITRYRALRSYLCREADLVMAAATTDAERVMVIRRTTNPDIMAGLKVNRYNQDMTGVIYFARVAHAAAKRLFGDTEVGPGFYGRRTLADPDVTVLIHPDDALWRKSGASTRNLTTEEAYLFDRRITHAIATEDPMTIVAVTEGSGPHPEAEPFHVNAARLRAALAHYGDDVRQSDLVTADPAPVLHNADASWLLSNFTWFNIFAGAPDEAERRAQWSRSAVETASAMGRILRGDEAAPDLEP